MGNRKRELQRRMFAVFTRSPQIPGKGTPYHVLKQNQSLFFYTYTQVLRRKQMKIRYFIQWLIRPDGDSKLLNSNNYATTMRQLLYKRYSVRYFVSPKRYTIPSNIKHAH